MEQKSKRLAQEEKDASKRQKTLERELEWVRMAPKARHTKNKARLNNYNQLLAQETKDKEKKLEIFIPSGPRLGNNVIEAKNVVKLMMINYLCDLNFNCTAELLVSLVLMVLVRPLCLE